MESRIPRKLKKKCKAHYISVYGKQKHIKIHSAKWDGYLVEIYNNKHLNDINNAPNKNI